MLLMFKDLKIAYWLMVIVGCLSVVSVSEAMELSQFVVAVATIIWILICAWFFNNIGKKRIQKMFHDAGHTCNVEGTLNKLFGLYKGRINNRVDLLVAIYISSYLLHFGKHKLVLKLLLPYNVEMLYKSKRYATFKYLYYHNLSICYSRLGRKEEALAFHNKSDEIFNTSFINPKVKAELEATHKICYLTITNNGEQTEEILYLLNNELSTAKVLLAKVSCRFSIANILVESGRAEEAKEHLEFIKENGGDTVYKEIATQNEFNKEVFDQINSQEWNPTPIKPKDNRVLVASAGLAIILIAVTVMVGFLTKKTIYTYKCGPNADIIAIKTFDRNGNILTWEMKSAGVYSYEDYEKQYDFCYSYLFLDDYDGCEVKLDKNAYAIKFSLIVDYRKTTDIDKVLRLATTEQEYIKKFSGSVGISKYEKFLGITVLTKVTR